jgi:hypothetical protein
LKSCEHYKVFTTYVKNIIKQHIHVDNQELAKKHPTIGSDVKSLLAAIMVDTCKNKFADMLHVFNMIKDSKTVTPKHIVAAIKALMPTYEGSLYKRRLDEAWFYYDQNVLVKSGVKSKEDSLEKYGKPGYEPDVVFILIQDKEKSGSLKKKKTVKNLNENQNSNPILHE